MKTIRTAVVATGLTVIALFIFGAIKMPQVPTAVEVAANQAAQGVQDKQQAQSRSAVPAPTVSVGKIVFGEIKSTFKPIVAEAEVNGATLTVENSTNQWHSIFTQEKLTVKLFGKVSAIIDLSKDSFSANDVWTAGNAVYLKIPHSEIYQVYIDESRTLEQRENGLFKLNESNMDPMVRTAGSAAIEKAAVDYGLLKQADTNAVSELKRFLTPFANGMQIVIQFKDYPPTE